MRPILILTCLALAQTARPFPHPKFISPSGPSEKVPSEVAPAVPSDTFTKEMARIGLVCESQPAGCVEACLRLWESVEGRASQPILLACVHVSHDSAEALLQAVADHVAPTEAGALPNAFARTFFGEPSRALSSHLANKRRLYDLALRSGCWESILGMAGNAQEKEAYVLAGLRECKTLRCSPPGAVWSVQGAVSDDAIADVRTLVRGLNPADEGFWIAVRTLVDSDDTQIVADLKRTGDNSNLTKEQRENARLYAVKLEYQHSADKLLRVVREERESKRVLKWAVRRLLWLGTSRSAIHRALAENQGRAQQGPSIAKEVDDGIRACEKQDAHATTGFDIDLSVLDKQERTQYYLAFKQQGLIAAVRRYSFCGLVTSAPAGD